MKFDSNRINLGLIIGEKINLGLIMARINLGLIIIERINLGLIALRIYLGLNSSKRENTINLELIGKVNLIVKLDFTI